MFLEDNVNMFGGWISWKKKRDEMNTCILLQAKSDREKKER